MKLTRINSLEIKASVVFNGMRHIQVEDYHIYRAKFTICKYTGFWFCRFDLPRSLSFKQYII